MVWYTKDLLSYFRKIKVGEYTVPVFFLNCAGSVSKSIRKFWYTSFVLLCFMSFHVFHFLSTFVVLELTCTLRAFEDVVFHAPQPQPKQSTPNTQTTITTKRRTAWRARNYLLRMPRILRIVSECWSANYGRGLRKCLAKFLGSFVPTGQKQMCVFGLLVLPSILYVYIYTYDYVYV